ncbi:hypothetical protein COCMIDRAFT_25321 [Bipolaris oryzae ATCC 44560]|uniref:Uncharacterized protein n=1 Tax=Bipolaris oryzae ATCC 44560 TaxID=930090 RepID=W6ZSU2_COCMI|nr:uncharacterized protein COCMIDRAFT_25321 [Bipolaris oryzae ATCC 44560]EUC46726.1 hypothetical protein COCMIDRAFT_25321 [Bipolaris oryzae ATCC 44560]
MSSMSTAPSRPSGLSGSLASSLLESLQSSPPTHWLPRPLARFARWLSSSASLSATHAAPSSRSNKGAPAAGRWRSKPNCHYSRHHTPSYPPLSHTGTRSCSLVAQLSTASHSPPHAATQGRHTHTLTLCHAALLHTFAETVCVLEIVPSIPGLQRPSLAAALTTREPHSVHPVTGTTVHASPSLLISCHLLNPSAPIPAFPVTQCTALVQAANHRSPTRPYWRPVDPGSECPLLQQTRFLVAETFVAVSLVPLQSWPHHFHSTLLLKLTAELNKYQILLC